MFDLLVTNKYGSLYANGLRSTLLFINSIGVGETDHSFNEEILIRFIASFLSLSGCNKKLNDRIIIISSCRHCQLFRILHRISIFSCV